MMNSKMVSIVVPLYNEEDNVDLLYSGIKVALVEADISYEVVFVDDGSSDKTVEKVKGLASGDERVRLVVLRRNFGQTAAMAAGFDHAVGDVVFPMDGDLQNDPSDIPVMLEKLKEGYDVVSGWRKNRQDAFFSRKFPSIVANWIISKITGVALHDYGCTLKAYKREVIQNLNLYGEMHRFIPALASWGGAKVAEVSVMHHARKYGQSKYGISRTFRVILDLITVKFLLSYSTKPIQIFGGIGLLSFMLSFFSFLEIVVGKYCYGEDITGNPFFLFFILFALVGVQLITMGLLGEINIRTYYESQGKQIYVIKEII